MAAASSIQPPSVHSLNQENAPFLDSDSPEIRQDEDAASEGTSLRDLPDLEPEEIEKRLEKTRHELSNRRKILIKNLPQDTTNQEVHEILREYELKYCFVDRNKGTAFVTLLNGDQAQDAIHSLHQSNMRGRDITVQLQPTDSLLCLTNLPHTFTAQQLEDLVRAYGNIERCFLVYSELTGHSKGYGFVEYMKKDSASRARSELLGRPQGDRAVMVQWTDVNQLTDGHHLHSKCLCVDRLPQEYETEELTLLFSDRYKPVFCQLAQDEGSPLRGFGVVEYESAEQAEAILIEMDRTLVGGQEIRLSLCTPGTSGRSTLAALIAAQGVMLSNKKGLLPEPNLAQLLNSMTNPAALQVFMRPYHTGKRGGKFGRPPSLSPFLRPPLTAALLQLGKVQQSAMLGNGLVLQNLLHMQLAQQQLLHIKDKHISNVSSLLGDPSRLLLQKALGLRPPAHMALGKGLLGDSPTGEWPGLELGQECLPASSQASVSAAGMMPYLQARAHLGIAGGGELNGACVSTTASDRQPAPPGTTMHAQPQGQSYSLGMSSPGLGPPPPKASGGHQLGLHSYSSTDSSPASGAPSSHISLLGEPPKEMKLPSNPYLNLASVLPGMVLQAPAASKVQSGQPLAGMYSSAMPPVSQPSTSHTPAPYSTETSADYSHYSQAYSQEAMQQWYQHYQAQAQSYSTAPQESQAVDYAKEHTQQAAVAVPSYGDYSSYMQAVGQYYSQPPMTQPPPQAYQNRDPTKEADMCKPLGVSLHAVSNSGAQSVLPAAVLPAYSAVPMMPGFMAAPPHATHTHPPSPVTHTQNVHAQAASEWNQYYYNQARGQKREYPHLAVQNLTSEGVYVGQHSQGLGGQYADYFKKKRI
ncbi:ribonucleoprotein PTB-binding 2 isoform X3 [Coregonus clupeaformis]|uniref:ribonucleoprotein PTB-binding 2 isoform X3 n=1 Tax=Coregonus clupeaformis TaxID=59861 RepID=UPI001E1C2B0A|nr:ribonucleoprotein PTB-binding 2 isoform X3 [Coregonus clupeaformis]